MTGPAQRPSLAHEPDFDIGALRVLPSICRVRVGGAEQRIEAQTLAVLIALVRAQSGTVTREDLVAQCWQGRIVSDDAVSRAVAKVRALARLTTPPAFDIETVPKIGYRLIPGDAAPAASAHHTARPPLISPLVGAAACLALIVLLAGGASAVFPKLPQQHDLVHAAFSPAVRSTDVVDALLNLDDERLQLYMQQGWSPTWRLDSESNTALHTLMLACERNPTHDRAAVVRTARLLVEAGANPGAENGWGDTPLEIASSDRYCGPDHPVVAYLRSLTTEVRAAQNASPRR